MKISVLVIAHNEEQHIAECIDSLLKQTLKPEQITVIVHNSTDNTETVARSYPVDVFTYNGPQGIVYARIEGFRHMNGDMVLCIDGDSYAKENWVAEMSATLVKGNILVGSWVKHRGTLFGKFSSVFNKILCKTKGDKAAIWIWGPSFAFYAKDIYRVKETYMESLELTKQLQLTRNPEDYWLALFMSKEGGLEVTNNTHVYTHTKEIYTISTYQYN